MYPRITAMNPNASLLCGFCRKCRGNLFSDILLFHVGDKQCFSLNPETRTPRIFVCLFRIRHQHHTPRTTMSRQQGLRYAPRSLHNDNNDRGIGGTEQNMWSSMLDSVSSGKKLPEKNLLVLGQPLASHSSAYQLIDPRWYYRNSEGIPRNPSIRECHQENSR